MLIYIVWEGKSNMSNLFSIAKYEYKMQIKNLASYGILLFAIITAFMDNLPTLQNTSRLEFITDVHYFVRRIFSFDGLILLFGVMFIISNRLIIDKKRGIKEIFMSLPIKKSDYIGGKFLGNFFYTITLMYILLAVSLIGFIIFNPVKVNITDYITAIFNVSICIILPASFFVVASSVFLPEILDIRLFYLIFCILFLVNVFSTSSAEISPIYLFTQGDLSKIVWLHPRIQEIDIRSAICNLLFMLGIGGTAITIVAVKPNFWRN